MIRAGDVAVVPTPIRCHSCQRRLHDGESAWASDWKVIDTSGTTVTFRAETRYTCDDCEGVTP